MLRTAIWNYSGGRIGHNFFGRKHDNIYWYAKKYGNQIFNYDDVRQEYAASTLARNRYKNNGSSDCVLDYKPNEEGKFPEDVWTISIINPFAKERLDYPTQKPERLIEDIIKSASNPGDIVFDCFMGSGTTQADGRMVKIMPVNRIATKADLKELLANLPYKTYEKRKEENPNQPVERITIVCMGHEPDLKGALEQELIEYKVDIQIVDILRDKADLQLKRDSEAEIVRENGKLVVRSFYPMNLMQKLSLQKEYVEDWRQLVDSIMIDWNYDGVVMQPAVTDVPGKNEMVKGIYNIPEGSGTIKVKITDLLSESLEVEVR